jgi:hypothetical protein
MMVACPDRDASLTEEKKKKNINKKFKLSPQSENHLYQIIKIFTKIREDGHVFTAQSMPFWSVFWQQTTPTCLVQCDAQGKDVRLRQLRKVFLQDFIWQVSTVTFLDVRVCDRRYMSQITNFIDNTVVAVHVVVVIFKAVIATV